MHELAVEAQTFDAAHIVKFYETVPQLSDTVMSYVGEGLRSGDGVVIITTADHRQTFLEGLRSRGVETALLSDGGRLRFFDAEETLDDFCDARPDPQEFRRVIGEVIDAVERSSPSRRVRVYGEMVAVLCRAGSSDAALALEDLWNDFLSERPFQLLCAYALADFPGGADRETMAEVCRRHGQVEPSERVGARDDRLARRVAVLEQQARALRAEIGERKRVERELLHARKTEAVGRFAEGIAHELGNLLTVVSGHTELLLSVGTFGENERSSLQEVDRAARKAGAMTEKLVALSSRQLTETAVVDVSARVRELRGGLEELCGGAATLDVSLDAAAGSIRADASQFEQLISHLVANACDAVRSSEGRISIVTRPFETGEDGAFDGLTPGRYVLLQVRDNGRGIAPESLDTIFDPFYTTKGTPGAGLGLALVSAIVKQSGGHVLVESVLGRGSTFGVVLPRVDP